MGREPRAREQVIKGTDPFDYEALGKQVALQRRHAWDLEHDIPWDLGIDLGRAFLPLDHDAIAFPGASAEQHLALSQWMGLVVNSTISEMEDSLPRLRYTGWERILRLYPANPELWELGDMFFAEEAKHARAFSRYLDLFCETIGIDRADLDPLLPKAFGSYFQKAITANALAGGHAFWWVVAAVEEVSISIYHQMVRHRRALDPLYLQLHKRHLEEESRHANYAFLMLNVIAAGEDGLRRKLHRKMDLILSNLVGAPWVVTELYKFFEVKRLRGKHPFFDVLASCIPLYERLSKAELVKRMFFSAPYVSWLLNPSWRQKHMTAAREHGALIAPFPKPRPVQWTA